MVRILPAMSTSDTMTQGEIDRFLQESRIPLELGTVDQHGDPVIHPIWYHYENGKFYLITAANSKKVQNISKRNRVYFCVDIEARPAKGVKGKGTVTTVKDSAKAVKMSEKIITKYLDNIENPLGKFLIGRLREGKEILFEITPLYYSVWDDSKSP